MRSIVRGVSALLVIATSACTSPSTDLCLTEDGAGMPVVAATVPSDGAVTGPFVSLALALERSHPGPIDVTYRLRELIAVEDFSIVVMPDTQFYTVQDRGLEQYFHDQTQWIRDHRAAYNIIGVIHNGDLINDEPVAYQWQVANAAMTRLETPEADLPDGVPWGISVGNHDNNLVGNYTVATTARFNEYFGIQRFAGRGYYGGHHGERNDNSWVTFSANGLEIVVVNLMYALEPDPAVVAWARSVFESHPEAIGILNTHYLMTSAGTFSPQGQLVYDGLRDLPNVLFMTGGHIAWEAHRVDTYAGHSITSMLANYQTRANGGAGYLRIWEVSPLAQTVTVRTYSPTLDAFEVDADSELTLPLLLRDVGPPYLDLEVTNIARAATTEVNTGELEVGKTYEWYAEIRSCGKTMKTPLYRFTTSDTAP